MCLTICPAFDSIHSRVMKSSIIKKPKPNQTKPHHNLGIFDETPLAELIRGNDCKLTLL